MPTPNLRDQEPTPSNLNPTWDLGLVHFTQDTELPPACAPPHHGVQSPNSPTFKKLSAPDS